MERDRKHEEQPSCSPGGETEESVGYGALPARGEAIPTERAGVTGAARFDVFEIEGVVSAGLVAPSALGAGFADA